MAPKTKKTGVVPSTPPEEEVETGYDSSLPFTMPYSPPTDPTGRYRDDGSAKVEIGREGLWDEEGPSVRQLVAMRKQDGQARALYRLLTLPIRSALNTATFVAEDEGEQEAEFIEAVFRTPSSSGGMTVTLQRFMSQMLMGTFDGFAAFEKVFWIPPRGPLKGKITLKKLAYRPSDTVSFVADEHGSFKGIRQQVHYSGRVIDTFIPREYCFYWAAQEEERKFYGISFFQSAFYHYDKKVKLYFTAHLAAQRAAVGTRVGTVPANASKAARTNFSQSLANMAMAQWMTIPEGFKVDTMKEAGSFDFLSLINHHNSQMSKSVLASFFDQSQGGGASDTSLVNFAQPGDDMFVLMLRAIMDDIADQINHYIIPQLIDFNFKGGKYPKFVWGTLTDEQRDAVSKVFEKIIQSGTHGTLPTEFVRALERTMADEMGLDIDWEEVEAREAQEAAAAAMGQGDPGAALPGALGGAPPTGGEVLTAETLGLSGDWTLEDFEAALSQHLQGQGAGAPEEDAELINA